MPQEINIVTKNDLTAEDIVKVRMFDSRPKTGIFYKRECPFCGMYLELIGHSVATSGKRCRASCGAFLIGKFAYQRKSNMS